MRLRIVQGGRPPLACVRWGRGGQGVRISRTRYFQAHDLEQGCLATVSLGASDSKGFKYSVSEYTD